VEIDLENTKRTDALRSSTHVNEGVQ
jgi:hypothetical protein